MNRAILPPALVPGSRVGFLVAAFVGAFVGAFVAAFLCVSAGEARCEEAPGRVANDGVTRSKAATPSGPGSTSEPCNPSDLATIREEFTPGFANAGWKYDRYEDLPSLDAGTRMVVADLEGPGIIRHFHTTRHHPADMMARGIVLEITFDDAEEPAVLCPLADFFGDGSNGEAMYFTSSLIECAPWSYNCYFPMPFRSRARVVLRNDTARDAMNYSYVEWEPLGGWRDDLGYFHATYRRKTFQLGPETKETFIELRGPGHLVGRQFSVATDEPLFRDFNFLMEGNNEVDIDGRERALDYLGTEDSFTFSWGFQSTFAGLRAGMTHVDRESETHRLSMYRFHDHMPLRFVRDLRWSIDWSHERSFTRNPKWAERIAAEGCWADFATVFYWYGEDPGGYRHEPLASAGERQRPILRSSVEAEALAPILERARTDDRLALTFDRRDDLDRVAMAGNYAGTHPFWIDEPAAKGGHPGNPHPGRRGILAVHPESEEVPCVIVRKVALPAETTSVLRLAVSGDPYEGPGRSDFVLEVGIHDGERLRWLAREVVDAGSKPEERGWKTMELPLDSYRGRTISTIVRVSYGGPKGTFNEEAFFDEISVVPSGE